MIEKLDGMTKDLVKENVEKLKELFPSIVKEDKIDFEELELLLGEDINRSKEQYSFVWNGKTEATKLAQKRSIGTLRPCIEESKNWDTTKNIYIEGDNLEVLKLLQTSYNGRIKMIYIDPPYNTGHDFVYKDNFEDNLANYKEITGQAQKSNADTDGRYHTNWLNMMYPRLKLARNLLTDDGVIFISIDDNEFTNLKKLCDDVFGENNQIGTISTINNLKGRSDDKFFATCNEFLLVYAKNKDITVIKGFQLEDEELENDYDKQDEIGFYKLIGFRKTGAGWERYNRPFMFYPVLYKDKKFSTITDKEFKKIYNTEDNTFDENYIQEITNLYVQSGYKVVWPTNENGEYGRWRWGRETFIQQKDYNLEFNNTGTLCTKMRATLEDGSLRFKTAKTLWYKPEYDTGSGAKILKMIFQNSSDIFNNPKSVFYIKDILKIATKKDDLVLDFFSGSATTAHAVMKLNAEDGGNRKFICVQLPEKTDETSEAYKAGYKNICEIGKERIRRAGEQIIEDAEYIANEVMCLNKMAYNDDVLAKAEEITKNDYGFKVFKLDTSNLKKWNNAPTKDANEVAKRIQLSLDYLESGRTELDLVYEIMLKYGLDLTLPITKSANGKAYIVNGEEYKLLICSEINLTLDDIESFANESVGTYLFADRCFADDNLLINTQEILKAKNKEMRLF